MFIIEKNTVQHSKVVIGNLMEPNQANIYGNVHGGEIMKMMDNVAGIVGFKHCRGNIVTARADRLEFHLPIHIGNLVNCTGQLTFVGRSSMEVLVTVTVEDLMSGTEPQVALTGYFTVVAIDDNGRPREVPDLEIINEDEKRLYDEGQKRYLKYKESKSKKTEV